MWARPDGIILQICKYGYCLVNGKNEPFDMGSLSSLGMGWGALIVPIVVGIIAGFVIGRITKKSQIKN